MASARWPSDFGRRKTNSLDEERDNFIKIQTAAVQKAINTQETPAKEKHVRSAIIGTFHEKGGGTFWAVVSRLQLQSNPILCWKFCYALHKILREGHQHTIPDSLKYCSHMKELASFFSHLKEGGYGRLIALYIKLLVTKLEFHRLYPRIPGNLNLTDDQLDDIGERDVNTFFELSTELMDYMEDILELQRTVFGSLDMSRANSMTDTGQCRIHPLIPCIQDSSCLYDYTVKILYKLHSSLPPDTLSGHRQRFNKQFKLLKQFYYNSSNLQYFKYLIQVPSLPENSPNFLIASDFSSHVSPVVILPPQEDRDTIMEGMLVDTSDVQSFPDIKPKPSPPQAAVAATPSTLFDQQVNGSETAEMRDLREKERIIESLMRQIENLKAEIAEQRRRYESREQELLSKISDLETNLCQNQQLAEQAYHENETLRTAIAGKSKDEALVETLRETENKCKVNEEKFHKMRDVYNKLREQYITLLRTNAETNKQLQVLEKSSSSSDELKVVSEEKVRMEEELKDVNTKLSKLEEENVKMREEIQQVFSEKADLHGKLTDIESTKCRDEEERQRELAGERKEKEELVLKLEQVAAESRELAARLDHSEKLKEETIVAEKKKKEADEWDLLVSVCESSSEVLRSCNEQLEDLVGGVQLTCKPEYALQRAEPAQKHLSQLIHHYTQYTGNNGQGVDMVVRDVATFSHTVAELLLQAKAAANLAPLEHCEELTLSCQQSCTTALSAINNMKTKESSGEPSLQLLREVETKVEETVKLLTSLVPKTEDINSEELGDMVTKEMADTENAIALAAAKIEEMLNKSKEADTGVKLEVNSRILDSCTALMKAIQELVSKSRDLQAEIVSHGKGKISDKEFYSRNHRWTEGLISAAKAVGWGATVLVDAADKVVSGTGKFEELVVCSHEIASSTAQLVVASKVKADKQSERLKALGLASKGVTQATGNVVASAKTASQMIEEKDSMDFSTVSLHHIKRMEMNSQVRVLELEKDLVTEREKLASLRKEHYKVAGASEGWDEEDFENLQ